MYKANEVIPIPHLHMWLTTYGSLIASIEESSKPSNYYSEQGYLFLGETSVYFTVRPDFNEVADKISALEKRKDEVTKEFQETIGKLNTEITKLKAIENRPSEAGGDVIDVEHRDITPVEDNDIPF